MNAVSFDIMTLLAANALGTIGTDLFAMEWGEGVDAQTLITEGNGLDSTLKEQYENPTFKIMVRGEKNEDSNTSYQALRAIHEFLLVQPTQIINGQEYLQYEPMTNISGLGRDKNNRAIWTITYYTFRNSL